LKILAIRFARLGDIVLLLPALISLKSRYPQSELTFLTDNRFAALAELCPAIDEVIGIDRMAMRDGPPLRAFGGILRLVRGLRRQKYDLLIDFHSFRETNLLAWFSGARQRIGMKRHETSYLSFCFNMAPVLEDKQLHVSEMFARVVERFGAQPAAERTLLLSEPLRQWAAECAPKAPRIALYVDAPVPDRVWPAERFALVADYAAERLGCAILVISGPSGHGLTERVRKASKNPNRITAFTELDIAQLVAVIASARLLISNDTGPMHLGPAVGVSTLGLFSVGHPEHFRPTGPNDRFIKADQIEAIEARAVISAMEEMWAIAADPGLRR
jgi:ADP-heptose:LPS heptosyltransferase